MLKLPRAPNAKSPYVLEGDVWNRAAAELERLGNIASAGAGLAVSSTPTGITISLAKGVGVIPARITDVEDGGGWYTGRSQGGFGIVDDGTADADLPLDGTDDPGSDDLLILNVNDGAGAHSLPTSGNPSYGAVLIYGATNEDPARRVGLWLGGGDPLPTPRPLYSVLQAINTDEDVAFDGPRFQP
jgi:hypothetical protein